MSGKRERERARRNPQTRWANSRSRCQGENKCLLIQSQYTSQTHKRCTHKVIYQSRSRQPDEFATKLGRNSAADATGYFPPPPPSLSATSANQCHVLPSQTPKLSLVHMHRRILPNGQKFANVVCVFGRPTRPMRVLVFLRSGKHAQDA